MLFHQALQGHTCRLGVCLVALGWDGPQPLFPLPMRPPNPVLPAPGLQICPLFAALPVDVQNVAFEPAYHDHRKVILATNIAETAVTINGIRYVIDTGFVKVRSKPVQAFSHAGCVKLTSCMVLDTKQQPGFVASLPLELACWEHVFV
jgi:hypothetical protein